jgi:hypothetical protein
MMLEVLEKRIGSLTPTSYNGLFRGAEFIPSEGCG